MYGSIKSGTSLKVSSNNSSDFILSCSDIKLHLTVSFLVSYIISIIALEYITFLTFGFTPFI